jgi:hypothetical protein
MKKLIGITLSTVILTACATTASLHTPSGRPEVTIEGVTKKQVMDAVVSEMLGDGTQIKDMNEYGATFGKRTENFMAMLLLGSGYDSVPEERTTFNLVDSDDGVRVFASTGMVTNPGSAFEKNMNLTKSQADSIQKMLVRLKNRFNGDPIVTESVVGSVLEPELETASLESASESKPTMTRPVWLGMRVQNMPQGKGALVAEINKAGPAEQAGLLMGDIVVEFNGSAVSDADAMVPMVAQTSAGQRIPVKVLRKGQPLSFDVQLGENSGV